MRVPSMGAEGPLEEGNPFFPAESHEQRSLRVTESDKTEVTEYTCASWGLGAERRMAPSSWGLGTERRMVPSSGAGELVRSGWSVYGGLKLKTTRFFA